MKRAALFATTLLAAGLVGIAEPDQAIAATTTTPPPPVAVVIISCVGNPLATPTPANYVVATVDASANSPVIPTSGDCATAVAAGLSGGLFIRNIGHGANGTVIVYTLRTGKEQ
jgi:hypothetical protein